MCISCLQGCAQFNGGSLKSEPLISYYIQCGEVLNQCSIDICIFPCYYWG